MLKAGANPNAVNRNGETPLHLAAVESNLDVIRKLVRSGAKLDQRSYFFMDPNVPHITPVEQAAAGRNENAKGREAYEYFDNSHDLMADRFVFLNADQADKIEAILECQNPFVQKGVAEFNAIQIAILSGRFHEAFSKISPARQPVFLAEVIAVQSENLELLDYTDQFKPLLNAKFWQKAPDQFDVFIKALPNTLRAKHKNKLDFIQARFALKRDDKRSLNIKRRPKP